MLNDEEDEVISKLDAVDWRESGCECAELGCVQGGVGINGDELGADGQSSRFPVFGGRSSTRANDGDGPQIGGDS